MKGERGEGEGSLAVLAVRVRQFVPRRPVSNAN